MQNNRLLYLMYRNATRFDPKYGVKTGRTLSVKINWGLNFELNQKIVSWTLLVTTFKDFSMKQIF